MAKLTATSPLHLAVDHANRIFYGIKEKALAALWMPSDLPGNDPQHLANAVLAGHAEAATLGLDILSSTISSIASSLNRNGKGTREDILHSLANFPMPCPPPTVSPSNGCPT